MTQVRRVYSSIVLGCPKQAEGKVRTGIGRDPRDRKRMAVYPLESNRYTHPSAASYAQDFGGAPQLKSGNTHTQWNRFLQTSMFACLLAVGTRGVTIALHSSPLHSEIL